MRVVDLEQDKPMSQPYDVVAGRCTTKLRSFAVWLAGFVLTVPATGPVAAQPHYDQNPHHGHGHSYHDAPRGHPAHLFTSRDYNRGRGGAWRHEWHDGHLGWWWVVGPDWQCYPAPLYPSPNPYVPPKIAVSQGIMWYWCSAAAGYYLYVGRRVMPWQTVPVD